LDGVTIGVFGTDNEAKGKLESSVAKKSEAEGVAIFHRTDLGRKVSFLDSADYPERIQGYACIASIVDHAFYIYPKSGKLTAPDGELAVLLGAFGLPGTLELLDGSAAPQQATSALKGTAVAEYPSEERSTSSSAIDLSRVVPRPDLPNKGTLVYIDRAFTVKGVGTVALGFILSGHVAIHDKLRPIPGPVEVRADVKGIQINDEDFDSAGRGIRVGLSLRGVEAEQLQKSHWLDDGSFKVADNVDLNFERVPFYKHEIAPRDLHLQVLGETVPASFSGTGGSLKAVLPWQVPVWDGMRTAVLDLNGKGLRVAGRATSRF
jgi:selenocysteine-specific translation elongation factor